jgi:hypothetical protein
LTSIGEIFIIKVTVLRGDGMQKRLSKHRIVLLIAAGVLVIVALFFAYEFLWGNPLQGKWTTSKGEYFMQNIHNQYSVNYQNHKSHEHQGYLGSNRQIARYYRKMRKAYDKGMKAGTMKGVLNNERS